MSSPVIKVRTISGSPEGAIQMNNGAFARQIGIPSGWSKIRLGIRWHCTDSGGSLTGSNYLGVGLCSGLSNIFGDATTTHWAGLYSDDMNFRGTGNYAFATYPSKKVGATITKGARSSDCYIGNGAASASADISLVFVDITKGSPNYTFSGYWFNQNSGPANQDFATWYGLMTTAVPSGLANYVVPSGVTVAVDEATDGVFDSINLVWGCSQISIEVCDIGLVQLV